jgi:protein-tyrosine-phosphatase
MDDVAQPSSNPLSILFVCHGNTCRSVMAEALTRRKFGDAVEVSSAGISAQPAIDAATAIEALRTYFDIDASGHIPRSIANVDVSSFD